MAYLSFSCTALKLLHWKVQFRMLETGKDPLSPNEYFTQKGLSVFVKWPVDTQSESFTNTFF